MGAIQILCAFGSNKICINGPVPPEAVTVAVPLQILPQVKSVCPMVRVTGGGWVIFVEKVAVQVFESVTVIVTTPWHKLPIVDVETVEGVDGAESHE